MVKTEDQPKFEDLLVIRQPTLSNLDCLFRQYHAKNEISEQRTNKNLKMIEIENGRMYATHFIWPQRKFVSRPEAD